MGLLGDPHVTLLYNTSQRISVTIPKYRVFLGPCITAKSDKERPSMGMGMEQISHEDGGGEKIKGGREKAEGGDRPGSGMGR